jgi:eukaryotic translation initiation factor 2C
MGDMFAQRLEAWYNKQERLPENILFYREGVDSGEYTHIRLIEVEQIRDAWKQFAASTAFHVVSAPKITVVAATRRHQVRFYPNENLSQTQGEDERHASNPNCRRGTCVDSGVTHPNFFDFFLQSHAPEPGTSKPTYYLVLENGMDFKPTLCARHSPC